jgi:hypothetical protein
MILALAYLNPSRLVPMFSQQLISHLPLWHYLFKNPGQSIVELVNTFSLTIFAAHKEA